MFVRSKRRFKDGKEHRYWSVVENRRRRDGRVVQRQVLYESGRAATSVATAGEAPDAEVSTHERRATALSSHSRSGNASRTRPRLVSIATSQREMSETNTGGIRCGGFDDFPLPRRKLHSVAQPPDQHVCVQQGGHQRLLSQWFSGTTGPTMSPTTVTVPSNSSWG